tara:strand:+ start:83 stop:523 length:441 start_codon:yes stop_codon:yes gene_type:complete
MQRLFENWRNFLNERLNIIGYHVAPASAEESIRSSGLRGSGDSEDKLRKDPGEARVYFFSNELQAKMAMFEEAIVGNPNPPYILVPFDLRKVNGKANLDPELEDSDIYGPNAYYIAGDIPVEAILQKGIKHEDELKNEDDDEGYYY